MKKSISIIILFLVFSVFKIQAQEEKVIGTSNGIKVSYQLLLEEEGSKKDKYILIVNAINEGDTDLYYSVPLSQDTDGNYTMPYTDEEKGFSKIKVRNSTGLFGDGRSSLGEVTNLYTTDNSILFLIKKGQIYTTETTFKVKSGVKPLLTNTFTNISKKLNNFDLKIGAEMLDGDYIANCGGVSINISSKKTVEDGEHLLITSNGNQFIWLRTSETSFTKKNSNDFTLTFNKENQSFNYATSDGISCLLTKKI